MTSTHVPTEAAGRNATGGTTVARGIRASLASGLLREAALVTGAMVAYFGIRNVTAGDPNDAFANANRIVHLEAWLGIRLEGSVQASIVGSDVLTTLANWVYIWGHWPVILTTGVVLYLRRRDRYYVLRNALFISGGIGFLFFALVPVAPPRLLELGGLVDTVSDQSNAYRALQPPGLTNQYAAFPSLHLGWNLAVGIVLFMTTKHLVVRSFALLSPVAMGFAVVATANHYVVDVVGGVAVVAVGLAGAHLIEERKAAGGASSLRDAWPPAAIEPHRRRSASPHRTRPRSPSLPLRRGAAARTDPCRG